MKLEKGAKVRVRLHTGEVVEAVYDEPSRVEKDHWVRVNGRACRATNYTSDERPPRVIFVGPSCKHLVPVWVSVCTKQRQF